MRSQGRQVFHASVKTFWPGYEHPDSGHSVEEINRDFEPEFSSLAEQQAEVVRIQRSAYAKMHWPRFALAPIMVVPALPGESPYTATDWDLRFMIPTDTRMYFGNDATGRARVVLLHELAHAVDDWENQHKRELFSDDDGHGPAFTKLNIEMLRQFHSADAANKLEANFRAGGVEIAP